MTNGSIRRVTTPAGDAGSPVSGYDAVEALRLAVPIEELRPAAIS